jgi:hypothetical protein
MPFQVLDRKRYPLQVTNEDPALTFYQYEHRATIGWGTREFIVMVDNVGEGKGPISYIEEVVGGHTERIKDEELATALEMFVRDRGFLDATAIPFLKRLS